MSEQSLFCRKEVLCGDGKVAQLSYYRLENKGYYGILVEMQRNGRTERGRVENMTTGPEQANEILELLSRNSVTPCTLKEILMDLGNKF